MVYIYQPVDTVMNYYVFTLSRNTLAPQRRAPCVLKLLVAIRLARKHLERMRGHVWKCLRPTYLSITYVSKLCARR